MASGSILIPSPPNPNHSMSLPNGHLSPLADNVINADDLSSHSDSELSDAKDPSAKDLSPEGDSLGIIQDADIADMETSASSQDEDAEGSEDGDYESETPPPAPSIMERTSSSMSHESRRSRKRKSSVEEDEYIMRDPELYGLRRSGRARNMRRVVESSSEDEEYYSDAVATRRRKRRRVGTSGRASARPTPPVVSTAESDSDDGDVYVGRKRDALSKKERKRRMLVAAGAIPPSQAEVRFSTRRSNKVTNYNEDNDDWSDEDSETMTPNHWTGLAEDNTPAIDIVLKHRLRVDLDLGADHDNPTKHDFEYFIKWQGKAHYHATWETFTSLSAYRGYRKAENYFKKVVQEELHMEMDPDVTPDEKEQYYLNREQKENEISEYLQVERVIGVREGDEEPDYLVKWKCLSYDNCTWEPQSLVSELAQLEIDHFLDRSSKPPVSNRLETNRATRARYEPFRKQPDYIKGGELRDFQLVGINFLAMNWIRGDNVILADEMGLGKTVQSVSFMQWLRHDRGQQGPFLVVVPLSTIPAWAQTFTDWAPDLNYVVYIGNEPSRKIIREYEMLIDNNPRKVKFNALITTYDFAISDSPHLSQIKWQFLAVDEAHRLKNRDAVLYKKLADFGVPSKLLITGTPIQNNLGELSALMDFLAPGKVTIEDDIDLQSEAASKMLEDLTQAIQPYMLRRTKQKVENDLPPKTEKIIRVELSDFQLEYYKNILTRNYAALNAGANSQKQSLLNIMMELKKASNHPFMFPNAEQQILAGNESKENVLKSLITSSGKMMLLDRLLVKLKQDSHRVLIFSQMVKMLDILSDYLQLRGYQFQRLDGTTASGPRRQAIDHFNDPESKDFCFLLSTRAGGLGINLMTADTVVLFDSDWNPQADLQAMARAHRIGQKRPVTVYRLVSKDTVEEEVLERARNKLILEFITIQRGVTDKADLENRMARVGANMEEPNSAEDINRILKRRGQKMFEQSGNQKRLEELDIDAVLENAEEHNTEQPEGLNIDGGEEFLKTFQYTDVKIDLEWDDIIPKDQLEKIKAEEEKKKHEEFLQEMVEQNRPRKRKAPNDNEREQRAAKKRAREAAAEAAAEAAGSQDDSGSDDDPKRPLTEKEIRNLIRAHERYGSIDLRGDEMTRDAKLLGRDPGILKATLDEVIDIAKRLLREEQERVEALERESNKAVTKKDRKAVLFDYKGVKRLNAETLVERPAEMKMIREVVESQPDWRSFRVPDAKKSANYSCPWGVREDGMLCVGIARHGYGAWVAIRDDPDLDLKDKFFLEEHRVEKKEERKQGEDKNAKSPGAVHLVRRANYLLNVLKVKTSNGANVAAKKALENHHRNTKKLSISGKRAEKSASVSASPAPNNVSKSHQDKPRHRERAYSHGESRPHGHRHHEHSHDKYRRSEHHRSSVDRRLAHSERNSTPEIRRKSSGEADRKHHRKSEEGSQRNHDHHRQRHGSHEAARPNGQSSDPTNLPLLFKSVQDNLENLKKATKKHMETEKQRAGVIKKELLTIGRFINRTSREDNGVSEDHCWDYVIKYWPKSGVEGKLLKAMYKKILTQETLTAKNSASSPEGAVNGATTKA